MKIATILVDGRELWGPVQDGAVVDASGLAPTLRQYIQLGGGLERLSGLQTQRFDIDDVQFMPPVTDPGKIWCTGLNFEDYREALGRDLPAVPLIFLKAPSALVGHGAVVGVPQGYGSVYDELELTAVIGKRLSGVTPAQAEEGIFGYTILYDLTMHDIELTSRAHQQWVHNIDGFGPCGPWLVTADEVATSEGLTMRRKVNGHIEIESSTSQMRDKLPELISFMSTFSTLQPGDMVTGGTPPCGPCGAGDELEGEIEGIGTLRVTLAERRVDTKWSTNFEFDN